MHRLITIISQAERNDMEASSSKKCIELMDNSTSFTHLFSIQDCIFTTTTDDGDAIAKKFCKNT